MKHYKIKKKKKNRQTKYKENKHNRRLFRKIIISNIKNSKK